MADGRRQWEFAKRSGACSSLAPSPPPCLAWLAFQQQPKPSPARQTLFPLRSSLCPAPLKRALGLGPLGPRGRWAQRCGGPGAVMMGTDLIDRRLGGHGPKPAGPAVTPVPIMSAPEAPKWLGQGSLHAAAKA